jgi:galactokinase
MNTFEDVFGNPPSVTGQAPGRVNLLGEHTDYNDGYVLPTAIPQRTSVAVGKKGGSTFIVYAAELDETAHFALAEPPEQPFASYVYGCIRELHDRGFEVPPLNIHVSSTVPIGVGLSSSAALEVASLRALRAMLSLPLDDVAIAQIGQQAENKYAGVRCGIMDQMASSLADARSMLFLDTRSLARKLLPLPAPAEILVLDSGIARTLAASGYNERRAQCEQAARLLGVSALRDVTDPAILEKLTEPLRRRARHVVTENQRVLQALDGCSPREFGKLMNWSHQSLRDDYQVSVPKLDTLVDILQNQRAVYGARLTGAGFGGACVALCLARQAQNVGYEVLDQYNKGGGNARVLVPQEISTPV